MRLLHIIRTLNPSWGGPVEGVRQISAIGTNLGSTIEIVCMDNPSAPWMPSWKIPVHAIGASRLTYGYSPALVPWLTQNASRFDAVILNGIWMYFSAAARNVLVSQKIPFVVFAHGSLDPWFKRRYPLKHIKKSLYWVLVEHKVLRDAAATCFTTEEEKLLARNAFRPYRCQEAVVGYGIRDCTFSDEEKAGLRSDFRTSTRELRGRPYLLYLGRIHEKKGPDLLLRAFSSSAPENRANTALVIAGPGDAAALARFKRLAADLGIAGDVVWTGPLYDRTKWGAFLAADAFALPSHQENFGLSVVEALNCGVPVLISDKVNIWREIQANNSGIVRPDDLVGTTDCLNSWFKLCGASKSEMSLRARSTFLAHFNLEHNIASFHELLSRHTACGQGDAYIAAGKPRRETLDHTDNLRAS